MREPKRCKAEACVHCSNCRREVYTCDQCEEYLKNGTDIICLNSDTVKEVGKEKHFCDEECYQEWQKAGEKDEVEKKTKTRSL